jgi:peptide deformylase
MMAVESVTLPLSNGGVAESARFERRSGVGAQDQAIRGPVLKTRAKEVAEFDGPLKRLTEGMLQTLRAGEGRMAIAANQVGVLRRVFVAETDDAVYVLVNPIIEERSEQTEAGLEGCLSIPGVGVEVERHSGVVVSGQDAEGRPVRFEVEGEVARMMQHETDHLDGVLMFDRAAPEERRRAMREWRERMLSRG